MKGVQAAAPAFSFTVNISEAVNVTTTGGTPRISLNVGGQTRYASYASGTGTSALTFTYTATAGDLDLDGIGISSPISLNGGSIEDLAGNAIDASDLAFTPPDTSNVHISYPILSMDFTTGSTGTYSFNGTVYNSFSTFLSGVGGTFTNDGDGTYFDSSGILQQGSTNTPRFDYDPVTHAAKGLLIEDSRQNAITYSEEMDQWTKSQGALVTANAEIAPDGTMTAEYLEPTGGELAYVVPSDRSVNAGKTVTMSIFVKAATSDRMIFEANDGGTRTSEYDIGSGSIFSSASGNNASIKDVGNGWYRVMMTRTFINNGDCCNIYIDKYGNGDAGEGFYVWGAQLERGDYATSYIPTTTTAVTRDDDVFTIPYTSPAEGTLFAEVSIFGLQSITRQYALHYSDGGLDRLTMRAHGSGQSTCTIGDGTANSNANLAPISTDTVKKLVCSYDASEVLGSYDGVTVSPRTPGFLGSHSPLYVGKDLDGHLEQAKIYPLKADSTQVQILSTP